jgi:hypothetical protein
VTYRVSHLCPETRQKSRKWFMAQATYGPKESSNKETTHFTSHFIMPSHAIIASFAFCS